MCPILAPISSTVSPGRRICLHIQVIFGSVSPQKYKVRPIQSLIGTSIHVPQRKRAHTTPTFLPIDQRNNLEFATLP